MLGWKGLEGKIKGPDGAPQSKWDRADEEGTYLLPCGSFSCPLVPCGEMACPPCHPHQNPRAEASQGIKAVDGHLVDAGKG